MRKLRAQPVQSFVRGASRCLDMRGAVRPLPAELRPAKPLLNDRDAMLADTSALTADWTSVGNDLASVNSRSEGADGQEAE